MSKNITINVGTLGMGLWRSPDGGQTWGRGRIGNTLQGGRSVYGLTVHPKDPSILYAGADDGIYISRNSGAQFDRMPSPMDGMHVWRVAIYPDDPDTIFAGTSPVLIYRSKDAGESWEMVCDEFALECPNVGTPRVTSLVINPTDPKDVWVTVEVDGIRRSRDGGDTWTRYEANGIDDPDVHDIQIDADDPERMFVTVEYDVRYTKNAGQSWATLTDMGKDVAMPYTRCVQLLEGDPKTMLIAIGDASVGNTGAMLRSTDGGETFEFPTLPVAPSSHIECFATHPADPELVLACTHYGQIFGSSDGGDWWVKLQKEVTENRGAFVWAPN